MRRVRTDRPVLAPQTAILLVFVCSLSLGSLDSTVVNVALPSIGRDFGVGSAALSGISVAYLVSYAIAIPISAFLGDRFGCQRVLLTAIAVFTVSSGVCGLCPGVSALICARAVQGLAGGMMMPVGLAMLYRAAPQSERVRLAAVISIPPSSMQALGPVVGGTVSTLLGWRWVFLFNLPIGLAVLAIGVLFLPDDGHRGFAQLDLVGLVLLSLGLGLGLFGISQGPAVGWTSEPVLISLAVGSVSLLAACWFELRTTHPLLDLRMFTSPVFTAASTVSVAAAMAFTGWVFLIAQFLQQVKGLSALAAGLATLPQMLGVIVGSALVSKLLVPRLGSRRTVDVGLAVVALSLFAEAAVLHSAPLWVLLVLFGITGVANPISFLTVMAAGFALTPPEELNRATALYNTIRQVGAAVGVAVVTAVLVLTAGARDTHAVVSSPSAYRDGLITLAVIAALGIAWTRHLSDADGVLDAGHVLIIEAAG